MPEPHNPERTPDGEQHHFSPSVPDLRPNLGEYHTVGTGNPDRGLATHFENNELGRQAQALNLRHEAHSIYAERENYEAQESAEGYKDTEIATEELRLALEDLEATDPENLGDKFALTQALKILEARKARWQERQLAAEEEAGRQERAAVATGFVARQHLREHEEAYKNQAVNDYRRAQAADPIRYPEPLNYPGYTDQEPPVSLDSE